MQPLPPAFGQSAAPGGWSGFPNAASVASPMNADIVERSWERSRQLGLEASHRILFNEVTRAHERRTEESNRSLIAACTPEMTALYQSLVDTPWMLACVNADGTVVKAVGTPPDEAEDLRLALRTGVTLSERIVGTTGPGCALIEEKPVIVRGDDHFLQEAKKFVCAAVPMFDPQGRLLGALDASCKYRAYKWPLLEPLVIAARAIENRLVQALLDTICIRIHYRSDILGSPLEGILAFSADGLLMGFNQTARHLLSIDYAPEAPIAFESLFDIAFPRAVDRLRTARGPMALDCANGMRLPARIGKSQDGQPEARLRAGPAKNGDSAARSPLPAAPMPIVVDDALGADMDKARRAFARDIPMLLNGETGTGKEVLAQWLHAGGPRGNGPFVAINCSAIPASLIESELFGYVEGSFTGGRRGGATGKLEQANGGTLFLDEIGDMPLELQGRLLRALQERRVTRLGGDVAIDLDISLICATHRNLAQLIDNDGFREDLYYRINGLRLLLPPLRERNDIRQLIMHFLGQSTAGRPPLTLSNAALKLLIQYPWPGNIRQLQHAINLAAVLAEDEGSIEPQHLPAEIGATRPPLDRRAHDDTGRPALPPLEQMECTVIRTTLLANNGNVSATARALNVSRQTIYRRLRQLGIDPQRAGPGNSDSWISDSLAQPQAV